MADQHADEHEHEFEDAHEKPAPPTGGDDLPAASQEPAVTEDPEATEETTYTAAMEVLDQALASGALVARLKGRLAKHSAQVRSHTAEAAKSSPPTGAKTGTQSDLSEQAQDQSEVAPAPHSASAADADDSPEPAEEELSFPATGEATSAADDGANHRDLHILDEDQPADPTAVSDSSESFVELDPATTGEATSSSSSEFPASASSASPESFDSSPPGDESASPESPAEAENALSFTELLHGPTDPALTNSPEDPTADETTAHSDAIGETQQASASASATVGAGALAAVKTWFSNFQDNLRSVKPASKTATQTDDSQVAADAQTPAELSDEVNSDFSDVEGEVVFDAENEQAPAADNGTDPGATPPPPPPPADVTDPLSDAETDSQDYSLVSAHTPAADGDEGSAEHADDDPADPQPASRLVSEGQRPRLTFTRQGSQILRLDEGVQAISKSLVSVRSTIGTLKAGDQVDPTRPTLVLMAAGTLVAAILSTWTLVHGSPNWSDSTAHKATPTAEASSDPTAEATSTPAASADPAAVHPQIAAIEVISYNNDDGDHPELANAMLDGDAGTVWQSRYFDTPELPEGNTVRLVVHLKETADVSHVVLTGPVEGGQVDLRINDGSDPFGTQVLTSAKMGATTTLTPSNAVEGTTVTLNFYALPTDDEGRYRVKLSALQVK